MSSDSYDWIEIEDLSKEEFFKIIYDLLSEGKGFKVGSLPYGCRLIDGKIIEMPINKDHGSPDQFYEKYKNDIFTVFVSNVQVKSRKHLLENFTKYTKKNHKTLADVIQKRKEQGRDPWE